MSKEEKEGETKLVSEVHIFPLYCRAWQYPCTNQTLQDPLSGL